jgi:hypothetical protein
VYPHNFPSLVEGELLPLVFIGAGLSWPRIGPARELANRIAAKVTLKCLGATACDPKDMADCLYCVTQARLTILESAANSTMHPRLRLAEELGVLDDPIWQGQVDLPSSRNYPRHRVMARLVADRRVEAIVCLNWDCFLEAALDAIGLRLDGQKDERPGPIQSYVVVIGDSIHPPSSEGTFRLIKPHGCARNLEKCRINSPMKAPIFKVTQADLSDLQQSVKNETKDVTDEIRLAWKGRPIATLGWSSGEKYLLELAAANKSYSPSSIEDVLSVVSKEWSHEELALYQGSTKEKSYFEISGDSGLKGTDRLTLWVYGRFALRHLQLHASDPAVITPLGDLVTELKVFTPDHLVSRFCDDFLPTWCRLCWRLGAITYFDAKKEILSPTLIPMVPRDWHVPFGTHQGDGPSARRDLQSGSRLLIALAKAEGLAWDFSPFSGGLWNEQQCMLVIPIPAFSALDTTTPSGIQPMIAEFRRSNDFCRIRVIRLLALTADGVKLSPTDQARLQNFYSPLIAGILRTLRFSVDENGSPKTFELIELDSLG